MRDEATVAMTDDEQYEEEAERQFLEETLAGLGSKLHTLAHDQVAARNQIETRWLTDLRQYHGDYTPDEIARMKANDSSQVYVNITRNKTRAAIARLSDMLLPNDDRNFGLKPTPVPATSQAGRALQHDGMSSQAVMMGAMGQAGSPQFGQPDQQKQLEQAARAMQQQIEDDFTEASYNGKVRDVIDDACKLGTGILKGPTVVNRARRAWVTDPQSGRSVLEVQEEFRPSLERVDPWDFFPDMSACSMKEAEFVFERKLVNRKQLRELADLPGVIPGQLRKALEDEKGQSFSQDRRDELRAITGVDTVASDKRWELWEYWGPLDKDELRSCGCDADDDPLVEYTGCVLMVGPHVIKAAINPLDTDDLPYSVFNWEEDRSSIFGFGVPYLMRHPQRVVNAAWRMMMDNAGLSAGPQVVVSKKGISPADGSWTIRPRKVWFATGEGNVDQAFKVFNIQSNQGDLFAIFQAAQQLADTETNLPILLQGEGASGGPGAKTATGMQMLMNNSNIVLRSAVKNFDDGITEPTVRRFYDYHMLYTDRAEIKGDFDIVARGSTVLVAREEQQEKLIMLTQVAGGNPLFAQMTDWHGLYKEILRSMQVPVDSIVKSEETLAEEQQSQGQQEPPPEVQIKMAEMQLKQQELQLKAQQQQTDLQLRQQQQQWDQQYKAAQLQSDQEIARQKLATEQGISLAELEARLGLESQKLELKMQETAAKLQTERDKAAAQLTDRQNDRLARGQNQAMGFDSYG
ncbi:hypothetical protein MHM84_01210 [Halomonas sp. McH1-25]|uniref:portal protein n=1 Tax=unclassified Halomonas TaxID=2609666 RepID=UPI001EF6553D|nr:MULTISPECIES: hypothetical protein [unclassified Halomonas]MCG7598400.1 hypothetical protein [Halomonas sp. McH1-25]MCP1342658.1 hypothetical protein [Halomonas sp. FL8]MCP1362574.1 hypothetical protein [Halomonas sp. BBD45]MCP1363811.1 hypothetical protein [Halomonas sp. BBD48]